MEASLKRESVGFWRVVFQGVTATAPAAIISTVTAASNYANGSLPLSYLIAFIAVLFAIIPIYQYSKKVPHAGGYYAYVSRSAGPFAGIITGLLLLAYQITDLAFLPLYFVILVEYSLSFFTGVNLPAYLWVIIALVTIILWCIPPFLGIEPSLNYSIIFGTGEVVALSILSIAIIIQSGPSNTFKVFTPAYSPTGINGVLLGTIFAMTSFLGYDSGISLAEEAKRPKETIKKSLPTNVIISGTFFILFSYAYTIGWGPSSDMSSFTSLLIPGIVETQRLLGLVPALVITFFGLESFFNSGLSFTNSAIRYFYGFARDDHVLPKKLAAVHAQSGVPRIALFVVVVSFTVLSIVVGSIAGLFMGFILLATTATILSLIVQIISFLTVWRLYPKEERRVFVHFVAPAVASILFAFIIYSSIYPFTAPLSYVPVSILIWCIVCITLTLMVRARKPEQYRKAGLYSSVE